MTRHSAADQRLAACGGLLAALAALVLLPSDASSVRLDGNEELGFDQIVHRC